MTTTPVIPGPRRPVCLRHPTYLLASCTGCQAVQTDRARTRDRAAR